MSITVTLTRRELELAGACTGPDSGMELFDRIKSLYDAQRAAEGKPPRRGLTIRWTRLHTIWAATAYPAFFGWLVRQSLIPSANLGGANLGGANLARANLARANLGGANLGGANLARANLGGANLARANLGGANLDGAYLGGAYLDGAYLDGAYLDGAYLDGARIMHGDSVPDGWEAINDEWGVARLRRKS